MRKMFTSNEMKYTQFCTLQVRVKRFSRIIVNITASKFFLAMIHPIMGVEPIVSRAIALKQIGHQMRSLIHKSNDVRHKIIQLITAYRYSPHQVIALNGDKHSLLFLGLPASFVLNVLLVSLFAADIFFIQLNNALKCRNNLRTRAHHFSDGMAMFACTFLRNTEPVTQKDGGYAIA